MPLYYYGIDWTYIILVLPAVIFALWAQANVNSTFSKYSKVPLRYGMTGREAAEMVLHQNGVYGVHIEPVSGKLTDHYDPKTNTIRLSQDVYSSTSCAAAGVAAHEAGHAVQYAKGYAPIKIRAAAIPIANIGSSLFMPLIILGLILNFSILAYIGTALFAATTVFQLITLPVEFNASRRAMEALSASRRFS